MIGQLPEKPTPQLGSRGVLEQEIKYRTRVRSWKSQLFWLVAFMALLVSLILFDLLA